VLFGAHHRKLNEDTPIFISYRNSPGTVVSGNMKFKFPNFVKGQRKRKRSNFSLFADRQSSKVKDQQVIDFLADYIMEVLKINPIDY